MLLERFSNTGFSRGAGRIKEVLWILLGQPLVHSHFPGSRWRKKVLVLFGASIGKGFIIKNRVRVKFPWKLSVGDNCWIGESVWIDNLAQVVIESDVCISQGAYLCTGSHDYNCESFDLITDGILLERHSWVCAHTKVAPGVTFGEGAVLSLGGVATAPLQAWSVYGGVPAKFLRTRKVTKGSWEAKQATEDGLP